MKLLSSIVYLLLLFGLAGCLDNLPEEGSTDFCPGSRDSDGSCPYDASALSSKFWSFSEAENYTYNSNYVEISSGKASLKLVDQTHTGADFNNGTHVGTFVDSNNNLTLQNKYNDSISVKNLFPSRESNLIGYWRFDGDENDSSSNGNHLSGIAGFTTDSKVGNRAGLFEDNTLSKINNSSMMPTEKLTFAAWVKLDSAGEGNRIIAGNPEAGGGSFTILVRNTGIPKWRLNLTQSDGSPISTIYSSSKIILGKWTHLVATADGENVNLYVDGNLDTSTSYDGTIKPVTTCWGIGARPRLADCSHKDQRINGVIDEVSLWDDSLTSAEVLSLFKAQNQNYNEHSSSWTPNWSSIVGYWKMDGDWKDSSGKGNHGTASDGATFSSTVKIGSQSGKFDGNLDYTSIPSSLDLEPEVVSMNVWVKLNNHSAVNNGGVAKGNVLGGPTEVSYSIDFSADQAHARVTNTSNTLYTLSAPVTDNNWHMWTLVLDGTNLKFYKDGVEMASTPFSGDLDYTKTENGFYIGGRSGGSKSMSGFIDDVTIWNTDLSLSDIVTIYNRQKQMYSGHYDSQVIDLGTSGNWSGLNVLTSLPYLKELGSTNESTSNYSSVIENMNTGLVGRWNFNETALGTVVDGSDITDLSGNNNHGTIDNTLDFRSDGKFNGAVTLRDDAVINFGSSASLDFTGNFTFSSWIYIEDYPAGNVGYIAGKGDYSNDGWLFGIVGSWSECSSTDGSLFFNNGMGSATLCSTEIIPLNEWVHVLVKYEDSEVKIFLNGKLVGQKDSVPLDFGADLDFYIGKRSPNSWHLDGSIDEASLWSRALSTEEIEQVYRRGANRVKYQVRSCSDSTCSSESFKGPDGTSNTYFSELYNNTTIDSSGNPVGTVKESYPQFLFEDFVSPPVSNRYFQYRIYMESDEIDMCSGSTCLPEVNSIELTPVGRYFGGAPTIVTKSPITYNKINAIEISESGDCTIGYQLSTDGTSYYFWNGTSWTSVSGDSDRVSKAEVTNNISAFSTKFGSGNLYLKAYLESDTSESCTLDGVIIENIK